MSEQTITTAVQVGPVAKAEPVPAWAMQLLVDVAVIKSSLEPIKDHEARIRSLERRSWSLAGVSTLGGAGLAQLVNFIVQK
jgi:hypothetical protein